MNDKTERHEIATKPVVYRARGMDQVTVRADLAYAPHDSNARTMDVYHPPGATGDARIPAVVFVSGYPDSGALKILGCKLKEMESYVTWARLTAASGLAAITYANEDPVEDTHALLAYVTENAASLGIDGSRVGIWACSGNVPNALSVLMRDETDYLRCGVLCYGMMLDLDGSTNVAEAARTIGFANAAAGKSVDDLSSDVPLFVVRAGQDEAGLNETIDRFVAAALARNLPVTLANHASAPHAFDILDDSDATREIIAQVLAFMKFHLGSHA